ncbi:NON-SPECIFIC LIPID-TRANSFER PROTEIN 10-RELATED [Salix koriyanagi]|uniref:Non-specific lipid-transfer protein n=1 Tax=Salix koriyanagi TaxID=2511006 RepID=A0A9Q0VDQ2_9ROSI|nr:NON-SPECIFIC LIPID-TRANSFER PROTEIN 10-RELATED [Salix koriyanagi]
MASSRALKFVCLVGCIMFMIASTTEAAIQCNQVVNTLSPCLYYVLGTGVLTQQCCNAIVGLNNSVSTTPDRQDLCRCLKNTASQFSFSSRNVARAAGLPGKCGVNLPYKIDPSTDCNIVQ